MVRALLFYLQKTASITEILKQTAKNLQVETNRMHVWYI